MGCCRNKVEIKAKHRLFFFGCGVIVRRFTHHNILGLGEIRLMAHRSSWRNAIHWHESGCPSSQHSMDGDKLCATYLLYSTPTGAARLTLKRFSPFSLVETQACHWRTHRRLCAILMPIGMAYSAWTNFQRHGPRVSAATLRRVRCPWSEMLLKL